MTKYITQERARYWPVSPELMAQYKDGTNTGKDRYGNLYWTNQNSNGDLYWTNQNGKWHRDGDKPAIIGWDGRLIWYQNGLWHRLRGPAKIYNDGTLEWWINGENITQEVNEWLNGEEWLGTPEQIFEFQLRFV